MQPDADITGTVGSITWQAEDGGWQIARLRDGTRVVGPVVEPLEVGTTYQFRGRWDEHPLHGREFLIAAAIRSIPADRRGVEAYLLRTAPGVGAVRAAALWDAYGIDAVRMLREAPDQVAERGIMPLDTAREAAQVLHNEAAHEQTKIELLGLLAGHGFQIAALTRIALRLWGRRAADAIRRNPYTLMVRRLPSAGFRRCDALYLTTGGERHNLKRQVLCAWHYLDTDNQGHTWTPAKRLGDHIARTVGQARADPVRALRLGVRSGWLAVRKTGPGQVWVAQADAARHELSLATKLKELGAWRRPLSYGMTTAREHLRQERTRASAAS